MRTNIQFLWINIIGGIAVLGGYLYALLNHPNTGNDLWGGIPQNWRAWIVTSMFIAAFGYIIAMYYFIYRDGLDVKFFWGKTEASVMVIILVLFFVSASMWIHSTFAYLEMPAAGTWNLIQFELRVTAISIVLITIGLASASDVINPELHRWSVIGLSFISFHCLILDAILWTIKFPNLHN